MTITSRKESENVCITISTSLMLENDATEIPTRISTGFPLERKVKEEKNSILLHSQSFQSRDK